MNVLEEVANSAEYLHYNLTDIRTVYRAMLDPTADRFRARLNDIIATNAIHNNGRPFLRRNVHPRKRPPPPPPQNLLQPLWHQIPRPRQNNRQNPHPILFQKPHPINAPPQKPVQMVECGCCMADIDTTKTIKCTNNHKVCITCIQRMTATENALVGKSQIGCLCMSTDCKGYYKDEVLEKVLDAHIYGFYQHNKRDAEIMEIKKALADDNIQFHKCAACKAYVETTEPAVNATNKLHCVFCLYDTCITCDVLYQPGHKCITATAKGNSIHDFEELETNKAVCVCICKRKLVKTEGCNKLTCVCKRFMCWCCKKDISTEGYKHFCNEAKCIGTIGRQSCKRCHTT